MPGILWSWMVAVLTMKRVQFYRMQNSRLLPKVPSVVRLTNLSSPRIFHIPSLAHVCPILENNPRSTCKYYPCSLITSVWKPDTLCEINLETLVLQHYEYRIYSPARMAYGRDIYWQVFVLIQDHQRNTLKHYNKLR